jgi:hypothetical protein
VPQSAPLVQGDVVRSVALDFVLGIILAGMMNIAFVVYVLGVHLDDRAAGPVGFRIPAYARAAKVNDSCLRVNAGGSVASDVEVARLDALDSGRRHVGPRLG